MKIVLVLFLVCTGILSNAQKIYNVRSNYEKKKFTIKYDITGNEGQLCNVRLFVSTDDGKTYEREVTDATGDIGDKVDVGKKKQIIWEIASEELDADKVKFSLQIMAIGMPPKKKKK